MDYEIFKENVRSAADQMTLDTVGRAIVGALTEPELKLVIEAINTHAAKVAMPI